MNKMKRRLGAGMVAALGMMALVGCGSDKTDAEPVESRVGKLALPLLTHGASGTAYRLRDATFVIRNNYYYYPGAGGEGAGQDITVSSETNPDAPNISVDLEEGSYYVELLPGWHFQQQTPTGSIEVEATALYGQTQWVYVSRHSTSFAEFAFGLGGREVWLNGDLNINVVLYEDPSELGYGGAGSVAGAAGASNTAGAPGAGGAF